MSEDNLRNLFDLTNQLYTSKIRELSNRLLAIRNSSFLDPRIRSPINSALIQLDKYVEEIKGVKKESKTFSEKFKLIRKAEENIRAEEEVLTLLEDVTDTFVSNRSLSTALSILFEYLYNMVKDEADKDMPFLITSGGGALRTFPYLKMENEIVVGTIGMPLYSASHIDEWILAGHELGHILANRVFKTPIKYGETKENFEMEFLSDKIALQIFGPVFLEALAMKLTGREAEEFNIPEECEKYYAFKHPPESWRIWMCYYQARADLNFNEARAFIDSIESIINDIYPGPKDNLFFDIKNNLSTDKYDMKDIRPIEDLKKCYSKASELSSKWIKDEYDTSDIISYNPDEIVIAGYLSSRKNIGGFEFYTKRVINSLIRKQNNYLDSLSNREYVASNIP